MNERIIIMTERLCTNPKCTGGRIGDFPEMDAASFGIGMQRPGDVCRDCGGTGIVRRQITDEEYRHLKAREAEEIDDAGRGALGRLAKWIVGKNKLDAPALRELLEQGGDR